LFLKGRYRSNGAGTKQAMITICFVQQGSRNQPPLQIKYRVTALMKA
jgi:hypothetical protein